MRQSHLSFAVCLAGTIAAAGPVSANLLAVRTDDCRQLVSHVPADDVTYQPGVDVRGRPVVPADLGGGYGITAPDEVNIDIRLDLAERLGLGGSGFGNSASALISGEGVIGRVTVRGNDIYWNNIKLARDSHAALAAACGEAFTAAGIPLPMPKPEQSQD